MTPTRPFTNPGPYEDLYEGDVDPDDYQEEGSADQQAPEEEPVAGPSDGAPTGKAA